MRSVSTVQGGIDAPAVLNNLVSIQCNEWNARCHVDSHIAAFILNVLAICCVDYVSCVDPLKLSCTFLHPLRLSLTHLRTSLTSPALYARQKVARRWRLCCVLTLDGNRLNSVGQLRRPLHTMRNAEDTRTTHGNRTEGRPHTCRHKQSVPTYFFACLSST